ENGVADVKAKAKVDGIADEKVNASVLGKDGNLLQVDLKKVISLGDRNKEY
ncbi:hypothetical protein K502DRAFT_346892, partial [Neoconidiobolus thromboides FSU 785]